MGILSTNTHLIGVNAGGTVSGAVRYDIAQDLTTAEQAQARANIGFDGALKEYSGGNNIKIQDYIVSVTGKKGLMIEDRSMTANESSNSIEIGVRDEYVQDIAEETVETVIDQKIEASEIITTIFRDSSLSGNGTQGSPLGIASAFKVEHDTTLTGLGTTASPLGLANDYQYTSPSGTSTINNDNHTIEQTNKAIDLVASRQYTSIGSNPHMENNSTPGQFNTGINLGAQQGQWFRFNVWTIGLEEGQDAHILFKEYNGVTLGPIPVTKESQDYEVILPAGEDKTLWYTTDKSIQATQICMNFQKYTGEGTPVKTVREMAWKDDLTAVSAQVVTNTTNIATNSSNIDTVSGTATSTWNYIQEHEPGWGAQITATNGITGTGSTASPLGLSALKVANSLSGNGVTSNIGLTASYALNSDLENTQATVLNNSNSINTLQESYDSLLYTVQNHTELINGLDNEIDECDTKIAANTSNIEEVSGKLITTDWNGMGQHIDGNGIHFSQMYDPVAEQYVTFGYDNEGTATEKSMGYTLSTDGKNKLINAATTSDLTGKQDALTPGYGISIGPGANNTTVIANTMENTQFSNQWYMDTLTSKHTLATLYKGKWRLEVEQPAITSWTDTTTITLKISSQRTNLTEKGMIHYTRMYGYNGHRGYTYTDSYAAIANKFLDWEDIQLWDCSTKYSLSIKVTNPSTAADQKYPVYHVTLTLGGSIVDTIDLWAMPMLQNNNAPAGNALRLYCWGTVHDGEK